MKVIWSISARRDRKTALDFIAAENLRAAVKMSEVFTKATARLEKFPQSGRPVRVSGTRELVVHPNYLLIYEVESDRVEILAVLHAAQKWPPSDG